MGEYPLRGFLVQAWDPSGARIGAFTIGARQKFMECSAMYPSIPDSVSFLKLSNGGCTSFCSQECV